MRIPFYDLKNINYNYKEFAHLYLDTILDSGIVLRGAVLENFEREFAHACGTKGAVGVASGLDAISLTLRALEVGFGDEVIVPSFTFIATWMAVTHCGATPIPVEVTHEGLLDPSKIEEKIGPKTKAIIPVHLYGQLCNLDEISRIAKVNNLFVIDDAAQAHGAGPLGSLGNKSTASAYSFYPSKNLGALGDGGAVTSNDLELLDKIRKLANYGSNVKYIHDEVGYNSRLEEFHAGILTAKLVDLPENNQQRRAAAVRYLEGIKNPLIDFVTTETTQSVFHLFVIRTSERERLQETLAGNGIETLIHYPVPPYKSGAYSAQYESVSKFPMAENLSREVLSLPLWPGIQLDQQNEIISIINNFR
jgi:dTDP-4-amino-4,6-dideoxygalactose transaminase